MLRRPPSRLSLTPVRLPAVCVQPTAEAQRSLVEDFEREVALLRALKDPNVGTGPGCQRRRRCHMCAVLMPALPSRPCP